MEKKLFLVKKVSQKAGKDPFTYVQLYCDLGYDKLIVSMDKNVIAQLLDVQVSVLYTIDVDKPVEVCSLIPNKEL